MRILGVTASGFLNFESDYDLITTTTLTSSEPSITFSNLGDYSSTYKHLQIRGVARFTSTGYSGLSINLRVNGATSGYSIHGATANGSSLTPYGVGSADQIPFGNFPTALSGSNIFGAIVIDFVEPFSATKNKTVRGFSGSHTPTEVSIRSGAYLSTTPISSIAMLQTTGASFVAGSRFSLYGIKG
jgi:hypothetical protein